MKYNCTWLVDFLPNRTEYAVYERDTDKLLFEGVTEIDADDAFHTVEFLKTLGVKVFNYKLNYNEQTDIVNYSGRGMLEVN